MKLTSEEKRTTRDLYNRYTANAGALRAELCQHLPLEAAMIVLELAQELTTDARERLLGHLRRWTQEGPGPDSGQHWESERARRSSACALGGTASAPGDSPAPLP